MATEIVSIQLGIPGPSGAGVSAAQWAALQAIVASATTGIVTVHATDANALLVEKADGTDVFKVDTTTPGATIGAGAGTALTTKGHIRAEGDGTQPTVAAGVAAGTSPSLNLTQASDTCGLITLTVGSAPTAVLNDTVFEVTLRSSFSNTSFAVFCLPRDSSSSLHFTRVYAVPTAVNKWALKLSGATSLNAATQYLYQYWVAQGSG